MLVIDLILPYTDIYQPIYVSQNPLLYIILAGQSGKLGDREVKMSALVSRRSWVRIPPESPVKFFHRHSESTQYAVLYTRRCRAKLNQLFITRRKNFINLYKIISINYFTLSKQVQQIVFIYLFICYLTWGDLSVKHCFSKVARKPVNKGTCYVNQKHRGKPPTLPW